jgi:hypothetical protein
MDAQPLHLAASRRTKPPGQLLSPFDTQIFTGGFHNSNKTKRPTLAPAIRQQDGARMNL